MLPIPTVGAINVRPRRQAAIGAFHKIKSIWTSNCTISCRLICFSFHICRPGRCNSVECDGLIHCKTDREIRTISYFREMFPRCFIIACLWYTLTDLGEIYISYYVLGSPYLIILIVSYRDASMFSRKPIDANIFPPSIIYICLVKSVKIIYIEDDNSFILQLI